VLLTLTAPLSLQPATVHRPRGNTPAGFTVAELTAKVHALTGQTESDYTTRQGAYNLRKLRAKQLVAKPGRTRRYPIIPQTPPAPSPRCSPCASRSSAPSSPECEPPDGDAGPPPGPASTAITNSSVSGCRPSSTTSDSTPRRQPHGQHLVDRVLASL
jgi:hypothetical protein